MRQPKGLETITSRKVRRGMRQAFGWSSLTIVFSAVIFAQAPSLKLDDASIGNTGQVRFKVFPATTEYSITTTQDQYSYETEDRKYVIFIDPDKITSLPRASAFTFDARVKRRDQANVWWYNVLANPVGKFADLFGNVTFRIIDGTQESLGSIRLPLHSAAFDGDLVQKKDDSSILEIRVSDTQYPTIAFRNTLETLGIHVTKVAVGRGCSQCWEDGKPPQPMDIAIGPSATASVPLNIRPKPLSAMLSTALILKRDKPQDHLLVTVNYNVDQGGITKQHEFDLPVRFTPSIWQLALAVIAGALVGALLKRLLDEQITQLSWKFLGKAIFLALVAEGLAAVAASYESKLIILSFDMDPRQVIPAALLAFAVTGGPPVTKWALGIIRPGGNQGRGAAGAKAGRGQS